MAGSISNPRVWLNADVYVAPVGTTAPTDTTAAFSATWKALGLLSEDGLTEGNANTTNTFFAWGGILIRNVKSKHVRTFKVMALEDNATLFTLINPGSSETLSAGVMTRTVKVPAVNPQAFALEFKDGSITKRILIPRGEITDVGDTKYSDTAIASHELTITVYPTAAGVLFSELTDDPAA
jgi:hypothetical protein